MLIAKILIGIWVVFGIYIVVSGMFKASEHINDKFVSSVIRVFGVLMAICLIGIGIGAVNSLGETVLNVEQTIQQDDDIICNNCGIEVDVYDIYCSECGTGLK